MRHKEDPKTFCSVIIMRHRSLFLGTLQIYCKSISISASKKTISLFRNFVGKCFRYKEEGVVPDSAAGLARLQQSGHGGLQRGGPPLLQWAATVSSHDWAPSSLAVPELGVRVCEGYRQAVAGVPGLPPNLQFIN